MCGITGFINRGIRDHEESIEVLDKMCRAIGHRGPDHQGIMIEGDVALGARRLAIIDLAGGNQPVANEDYSVTVVFNGEIYNHLELRTELIAHGHRFRTSSDTETIVHAYEEFGNQCVEKLRGMFSFAVWDETNRTLFVSRDRVGKKPLYYAVATSGSLIFGSELKSLLAHPEVEREIDFEALDAYLSFGYVPDPLSIFKKIRKLSPGHHLTWHNDQLTISQYWDFKYEVPTEARKEADIVEELQWLLDDAVRTRLISDVPLGAFLSGGVDSSSIVSLMARHTKEPVKTFSVGFEHDSFNELDFARIASKHLGTEHHELVLTPEMCDIVDLLVWHFDEPFADSSAIPTYLVAKLAREHVTVVLSGDGGDELFGGYSRYASERRRQVFSHIPVSFRRKVMAPLSRKLPHGAWGRNYIHNIALDPVDRYIDSISVFTELQKRSLCTDNFRWEVGPDQSTTNRFRAYARHSRLEEPLDSLLYMDSKTYLPGDILTKLDRMSMAVSLEARAPLLDHKLIEFVTGIPASLKLRGGNCKHIFKQAMADQIPSVILNRRKHGFSLPLRVWINTQLKERIHDSLTDRTARERGYVEPSYVRTLLDEHHRGRRDHSTALWSLLMLELWYRTYIDGHRSVPATQSDAVKLFKGHPKHIDSQPQTGDARPTILNTRIAPTMA